MHVHMCVYSQRPGEGTEITGCSEPVNMEAYTRICDSGSHVWAATVFHHGAHV